MPALGPLPWWRDRAVVAPFALAAAVLVLAGATAPLRPGARGGEITGVDRVVVLAVPELGIDDVAAVPALDRLADEGAVGALAVPPPPDVPSTAEARATLAAGVRATTLPDETLHSALVEAGVGDAVAVVEVDRTDLGAALGRERPDPDALLVVLGLTPPGDDPALVPLVLAGGGARGLVTSPGTDRPGVATLADVAPTVLTALGVAVPEAMTGRAVRVAAHDDALGVAREAQATTAAQQRAYVPARASLIVGQGAVLVAAAGWLLARRRRPSRPLDAVVAVAVAAAAAWPTASSLVGLGGRVPSPGWTVAATWALALALGGTACAVARRRGGAVTAALVLAGAAVATVVADLVVGGPLQRTGVLGHSPVALSRFNGVGNAAFGTFAAAGLVLAALLAGRRSRRAARLATAGAVLAVVVGFDVAPTLGNDLGGVLSLVPVGVLLLVLLQGGPLRPVHGLVAAGAVVAGLVALVAVDALRPLGEQGHLGQLAEAVRGDPGALADTVDRKWSANLRSTTRSPWWRLLPPLALATASAVAVGRTRSAELRLAAVAVGGLAVLGYLTNDSGILVATMALGWLPLLTVLPALDEG